MEEKLKLLEEDLKQTKEDLGKIMLDIRAYVMQQQNPLRLYEKPKPAEDGQLKGEQEDDSRKPD